MDPKTLFARTAPGRLFFLAAVPGAVGMLASALYQLIDGILVGQVLGEAAFAAINLAMPFVIINFALSDMIGVGSSVLISVRLGQKEAGEASNVFTCACLLIVGAGLAVGAVLFLSAPLLMELMGADGELAALGAEYLRVYALFSPVTTIIFASDNYLRICGRIRMSMWLNILMSVLTAVLEFVLLVVFDLGIWAAALASSLGMVACVVIALWPFARGEMPLCFCRPRFSRRMVGQIVANGSPTFLNNISGRITSILMNMVLLRLGGYLFRYKALVLAALVLTAVSNILALIGPTLSGYAIDAIEPGNHDFAWGQQALEDLLADAKAPVLNASIVRENGETFGQPYMIKDVGGVKVGMIGVDVENMARYVSPEKIEGLEFKSTEETLETYLPKLKEEGADVIMLLSHIGFDEDKKIAQKFPEIDIIVGGHSHTELPEGHYEGDTLIVQSGTKGKFVGEVDLKLDLGTKQIASAQAKLIPVGKDVEPDPVVADIVAAAQAESKELGSRVMGQATEDLSFSYWEAAKVNQIHADSLLEATGADIVLVSSRSPRGGIEKGEVTYEDLFNAFPHTEEDAVVMRQCPGTAILKELENRVKDDGRGPATPAGFSYTYDPSLPSGQRIVDVKMADGTPFDPQRKYDVATTLSMSRKSNFKEAAEMKSMGSAQEIFMDYFAAHQGPWHDDPDARVTKLGA